MNNYSIFAKHFLTENGWRNNCVIGIKNGAIDFIENGEYGDYYADYLAFGPIDNHIHGGNGFNINESDEASLEKWLNVLAVSGVCAVIPAPYGSVKEIRRTLNVIKNVAKRQKEGKAGGAIILGAHLEGSFISVKNQGSFSEKDILATDVEVFKEIVAGYEDVVKEITIAPENPGADKLIKYLKENNVRILAGHTLCNYDNAMKVFKQGVGAICHTFNCTPPIHHVDAGVLNAALTEDNIYCEMIGDLKHLHPSIIKLLVRAKQGSHVMLISDAISTANLPDGVYKEGETMIEVSGGFAKVQGTDIVAGANCYISKSVKNLVEIGIPFETALNSAGKNVAKWLGLCNYGSEIGKKALFTAWNENIDPIFTVIEDNIYEVTYGK